MSSISAKFSVVVFKALTILDHEMSVAMWNWYSRPLNVSTSVNHLTVLNGLSIHTFISQSVICCNWQFQFGVWGDPLSDSCVLAFTTDICQPISDLLYMTLSNGGEDIDQRRFICQIWIHFGFDSCFTEIYSTKDQWTFSHLSS